MIFDDRVGADYYQGSNIGDIYFICSLQNLEELCQLMLFTAFSLIALALYASGIDMANIFEG